ncbi:MAG: response regulator [Nitrososphaerales archaeon]
MKLRLLYAELPSNGGYSTVENPNRKKRSIRADSRFDHQPAIIARSHNKRLVLVDDAILVRTVYKRALDLKGFEILAAMSDGTEIVERIDSFDPKPDVILLDERMPRMSGVDACEIIHAKYPEIVMIFVSEDSSSNHKAMDAGAKAFLVKPVSISELADLINSS